MIHHLMYIELKTGYSDNGPAWIGYVKTSKTKKTIYFNDHAFQKQIGAYSNYIDDFIILMFQKFCYGRTDLFLIIYH